jgi:hypothetical protein
MPDDLVTIYETNDLTDAVLTRAMLEEAGMRVLEQQMRNPGLLQMPTEFLVPRFRLQVLARDAAEAARLVADFHRQAAQQAQAAAGDTPAAPAASGCGLRILVALCILVLAVALYSLAIGLLPG